MDLIKEAIRITLKTVEGSPDVWASSKNGCLTHFVNNDTPLRKDIELNKNETPIIEFLSETNYSLITSERVISFRDNKFNELKFMEISDIRPLIPIEGEDIKPWSILKVKDVNDEMFLIQFDSGQATYFVMNLIENIRFQLKVGRWLLNPSKGDRLSSKLAAKTSNVYNPGTPQRIGSFSPT